MELGPRIELRLVARDCGLVAAEKVCTDECGGVYVDDVIDELRITGDRVSKEPVAAEELET